eukprot:c37212_g1_i1.p1 GENE.c37212_g1_i1~~c37212_g1_i1.p1  ORF type:complete len:172 (-),score=63.52 c37212_g1_i1:21-536(-)
MHSKLISDFTSPNIVIHSGHLSHDSLLSLLSTSNCFLFPSSGEGFGLPPREAMSTGIPTISTSFAGLNDISDDAIGITVPYTLSSAYGYDHLVQFNNGSRNFGLWGKISVWDLSRAMLSAVNDQSLLRQKGLNAAKWIRKKGSMITFLDRLKMSFEGSLTQLEKKNSSDII